MIDELKTDYKDDVLATSQQGKRTFNIVGKNGEILFENVHIEDTSRYLQVGDEYGGDVINETNEYVNQMDDKLDELIEFMDNGVKAEDVTYNDSNVKLALDTLGTRITQLNSDLAVVGTVVFSTTTTGKNNVTVPANLLNRYHYFVISVKLNNLVIAEFRVDGTDLGIANIVQGGYKNADYNRYIELYGHDNNQIRINDCTVNGTDESANITVYVVAIKMTK